MPALEGDALERAIDELYRGGLEEFTPRRNALAKELKAAGDGTGSNRVKGLGKPSVTAWAVNQLHFDAPEGMARLLDASQAMRTGLEKGFGDRGLAGLRDAQVALRQASDDLVVRARELLEGSGHGATPASLQRIQRSLEALAARGGADDGSPSPPRLTGDLEPPGFDQLAGLALAALPRGPAAEPSRPATAPPAAKVPLTLVPPARTESPGEKERAEAKRLREQALVAARVRADEAARKAGVARDELARAERGLEEIAEAHRRAEQRRDELRRRVGELDEEEATARARVAELQG